VTNKS